MRIGFSSVAVPVPLLHGSDATITKPVNREASELALSTMRSIKTGFLTLVYFCQRSY